MAVGTFKITGQTAVGSVTDVFAELAVVTATLSGTGTVTGDLNLSPGVITASLAGAGTVTSALLELERLDVTLAGAATLTADVLPQEIITAQTLAGTGTLSGTLLELEALVSTLSGSGTLAVDVVPQQIITAQTLAGIGALSADVMPQQILTGETLAGVGTVTSDVTVQSQVGPTNWQITAMLVANTAITVDLTGGSAGAVEQISVGSWKATWKPTPQPRKVKYSDAAFERITEIAKQVAVSSIQITASEDELDDELLLQALTIAVITENERRTY